MSATLVVAIDGPSGSGKSSVSRAVASALELAYLDTGAMYRAATWWCVSQGLDLTDQAAVAAAVDGFPLVMGVDPANPTVHVGGVDVHEAIRSTEITAVVSAIATNLEVRASAGAACSGRRSRRRRSPARSRTGGGSSPRAATSPR